MVAFAGLGEPTGEVLAAGFTSRALCEKNSACMPRRATGSNKYESRPELVVCVCVCVVVYVYSTTGKTLLHFATQDLGASKTLAGWCFDLPISCKGIGEHDCLLYTEFTDCITLLLPPFVRLAVLLCNTLPLCPSPRAELHAQRNWCWIFF